VAQELVEMGYTKVYALKGGWREWLKDNYPTEKNEPFPLTHFPSELKNLLLVLETADDSQLCFDFGETNQSSSRGTLIKIIKTRGAREMTLMFLSNVPQNTSPK
jgi:hypothetical protein